MIKSMYGIGDIFLKKIMVIGKANFLKALQVVQLVINCLNGHFVMDMEIYHNLWSQLYAI